MRDGKLEGMQDFDSIIKGFIERNVVSVEDGLAFSTNQNNLLLSLKGLTSSDDFIRNQAEGIIVDSGSAMPAFSLTD
jgi:twitching motility protein PilT